ncbi:MAG: DUF308 domain-containing protein [Clostridia bacterium]|nr:DUF308 domain-containing protein [Clostridia bacterium]
MKKTERIISAALTIAFGVLLIALKGDFIGILMTVAGIALIVVGVLDLVNKMLPPAIIKMVVGVLIIVCGWTVLTAVLYIVAAVLLVVGILMLYDKIKHRVRCHTLFHTICEYAVPSLFIAIGIMLLFHQGKLIDLVLIISGILTIVEGGLLLANAFSEE